MADLTENRKVNRAEHWWQPADWRPYAWPLCAAYWKCGRPYLVALALAPAAWLLVAREAGWDYAWSAAAGCRDLYDGPPAVGVLAVAAVLWALRAWRLGSGLVALIALQAAVFCCREINFTAAHKGVYAASAAVVVLVVAWIWRHRRALDPQRVPWAQAAVLAAAVATYVVAVLVQRRVFRFLPDEQAMHIGLEEATEMGAHVLFLVSALVGPWRRDHQKVAIPPA